MSDPRNQLQADGDRLKGWKDIASYLQSSVRTVQRWEGTLRMPVHRIEGQGGGIVFASRRELDEWLTSSEGRSAVSNRGPVDAGQPGEPGREDGPSGEAEPAEGLNARRRAWRGLGAAVIVLAAAAAVWFQAARNPSPATVSQAPPPAPGGPAAGMSGPALFLKITPDGRRPAIVGLTPGTLGLSGLPGGETIGLLPSLVSGRLELRVYRVDGRTPEGNPRLTDLSRHWLVPDVPVRVDLPHGPAALEWVSRFDPPVTPADRR